MIKLLIVDDEPIMRRVLKDCFDWKSFGIEVVGEADDGVTGENLIKAIKPDIVLADVKMPRKNGIEMVKNILAEPETKNVKVIFISGHGDLEYLKSAISMSAVDYILKPVDFNDLSVVLKKTTEMVQNERKHKKFIVDLEDKLYESLPLLKEKFLLSLNNGSEKNEKNIINRLDFLDLKFELTGIYYTFIISIDNAPQVFEKMGERDIVLLSFAILNIANELIENSFSGYVVEKEAGHYIGIVNLREDSDLNNEKLGELLDKIKNYIKDIFDITVTIGVGKSVTKITQISKAYESAKAALDKRFFYGTNKILVDGQYEVKDSEIDIDAQKVDILLSALKIGDENKVIGILEKVFSSMSHAQEGAQDYYRSLCLYLVTISIWSLFEVGFQLSDVGIDDANLYQDITKMSNVFDMKEAIFEKFRKVCRFIGEKSNKNVNCIISEIKDIITSRYGENLTLKDIANDVYFTPTYICIIFKQETGVTINEYLTKVRIENAKRMLKETKEKFYNISSQVGYTDASYFSRMFKKYTGYSPSEFRDKA